MTNAVKVLLKIYNPNGANSNASLKLAHCATSGNHLSGIAKISSGDFNALSNIQIKGNTIKTLRRSEERRVGKEGSGRRRNGMDRESPAGYGNRSTVARRGGHKKSANSR